MCVIIYPRFSFDYICRIIIFSPFCAIFSDKKISAIKNIIFDVILHACCSIIGDSACLSVAFGYRSPFAVQNFTDIPNSTYFPSWFHRYIYFSLNSAMAAVISLWSDSMRESTTDGSSYSTFTFSTSLYLFIERS